MDEILHAPQNEFPLHRRRKGHSPTGAERVERFKEQFSKFREEAADCGRVLRLQGARVFHRAWSAVAGKPKLSPLPFLALSAVIGVAAVVGTVYTPSYVVTVDGADLGLVRSQSVFEQAMERVESRASEILGYDYQLAHTVSYAPALSGSGDLEQLPAFQQGFFRVQDAAARLAVAAAAPGSNALYLKIAFLLILCGYSCKVELFPLYTVGVDANFAAPAPASALISTGVVNAGFLAVLRVYKILAQTEVFPWVRSVLLLTGVLSLAIGALFLRRTNNYKRFLSYSTVENMGIAAIGLGIGGIGVWAAVFHVVCHTLIKSSLFLQIAVVRQVYNSYRINRIGDYIHINHVGAVGLIVGMVVVMAFPPSPLFLSEVSILREVIAGGKWWLVCIMLLLLCIVIYSFCVRMLRLCYQPNQDELHLSKADRKRSWSALALLIAAMIVGIWQPGFLEYMIDQIASL